ncbi:MAG: PIN domain-containing protein [Vicinamibacteria bacterium]|nr:PIN domain-containing protein [Vicinamibacteria bacterium]
MILVDAGPLVALADRTDVHHAACLKALQRMRQPLATVWPALTEAVYLVQRWPKAQSELLKLVEGGSLRILPMGREDIPRVRALMEKYRDLPMDLADAVLVRTAERERVLTVFTIDRRDFSVYRPLGLGKFRIVP